MPEYATKPIVIDYYSDVLCIWSWIAQRRIDELEANFGNNIEIRFRYTDVFGDVFGKMERQWQDRGGFNGFAEHVYESASRFDYIDLSPDLWRNVRPQSSALTHCYIKAVALAYGEVAAKDYDRKVRESFFSKGQNVGESAILESVLASTLPETDPALKRIATGEAIAAVMADYQASRLLNIKGSPSYVMDNGRQVLFGNVGYRVIHANVEQLLKNPAGEASWC